MKLLDNKVAKKVLDEGLFVGADFVDIYVEKNINQTISIKSSLVQDVQSGIDFGIGVRLIFGDQYLYAYSNSHLEKDLIKLVQLLAYQKKNPQSKNFQFNEQNILSYPHVGSLPSANYPLTEKVNKLLVLDSLCRRKSEQIKQVNIGMLERIQEVEIFNTDGLLAYERRPYFRINAQAIAQDGQDQASGYQAPGVRGECSYLDVLDMDFIATRIAEIATTNLKAPKAPAGDLPVVIDNGFGGVIFHEACGHLLETTSVQKKASVFWNSMGEMIAHPCVNAFDDGTNNDLWGSISIDDEGMPTQKTQLIKDGKLVSFLVDKIGSIKTGFARTGSGRKQNYKFAPASRMRNTYIDAGPYTLNQIIESVDYGIYAKSMGGGSVSPGTGEFNFAVEEGFIIKNGKIQNPVKGATLIGKGEEILKNISMVANNLTFAAGMCGSVSGHVPTTVGQGALKVDKIRVGGN